MISLKRLLGDTYILNIYLLIVFIWADTQTLSKLLISLILFGIIKYFFINSKPKIDKYTVLSVLFFVILLIGYLHGPAKFEFLYLNKSLSFLVIPFALNHTIFTKKIGQNGIQLFLYSCGIFATICFLNVVLNYFSIGSFYVSDGSFLHPIFTYIRLNPLSHPTYTSLIINITIVLVMKKDSISKVVKSLIIILLIVFSFFIASRLGLLISMGLGLYFLIKEYRFKAILFLTGLLLLIFIFTEKNMKSNLVLKRYTKSIPQVTEGFKTNNSISQRLQLYYLALHSIKDLPVFGYGARSTHLVIEETYSKYFADDFEFYVKGKNAHNQFLDLILSMGVLGFIGAIILIYLLIISLKNYEEIALVVILYMLFESLLGRFHGVLIILFVSRFIYLNTLYQDIVKINLSSNENIEDE